MPNKATVTTKKYPEKPITMIVPFSAGGGLDLIARAMEKFAPKYLGQPITIINKPGGAGTIGWNELAASNPDGYTLAITATDILLPSLYGPTKYDYQTAIQPLAQITSQPFIMVVQADQPWQTLDDVIAYAKTHPGQLKFGHGGVGAITHVVGEMFAHDAGITLESVPFRGASESTTALLGGHVQIVFTTSAVIQEYVKDGMLKALAVTGEQRLTDPLFAQIPTFKEHGLNIQLDHWYGIAAPKELPADVKANLAAGFKTLFADPEFKTSMKNMGMRIKYLGPTESQQKWLTDSQELSTAIQETGVLEQISAQKK
ncbi:tripartite-type tricarboxylate transporter receptor subunit TctC [Sporomusaceae bacterium BoRhaA]|uniref:tripartite tricarboxylate transporter substrate binding protein n=1 Tax=Pelorhabdus rhamnosifermentans TaxID=2772457 RepID=UPI001C06242A|nr:tripartite tricarboxylate transporter substrate binding protein [Pelorhabdus rhamnosifermentans]MBU2701853.1 tripartite-type tricarboxylate transporter receptor subunit TctC [Pelorhabdus rhamnosifermentans]